MGFRGTFFIIGVVALGGLSAFFLYNPGVIYAPMKPAERSVPEFALKDYGGKEVKLSDFRGKPVLVNTWASWCPYCKNELPDFVAIKKEFGDRVEIVAVDRAESPEIAKKYSDELVGVGGNLVLLLDPDDSFYKSIGGFSMPETIFVDKDGFIKNHKRGPMTREEMRRRIQQDFNL